MNKDFSFAHEQPQANLPPRLQNDPTMMLQKIQDLDDRLSRYMADEAGKRINWNTDIIGLTESRTVAPTGIPKSPYDQFKIAKISGTTYFYAYDPLQPTGGSNSDGWFRVAIS